MQLEPVKNPNVVLIHEPQRCGECGLELAGAPVIEERARQVFDLPLIHLVITEQRVQTRLCSSVCGTEAPFPAVASATTCYGPVIQGFGASLIGRLHLPVARTAELLIDAIGAPVSNGWLSSLMPWATKLVEPFLETAGNRLRHAPMVHFDETRVRVVGFLAWVHVACTESMTLLHLSPGRSVESMVAVGILGHGFRRHRGARRASRLPPISGATRGVQCPSPPGAGRNR